MNDRLMKRRIASVTAAAVMSLTCIAGTPGSRGFILNTGSPIAANAAVEASVKYLSTVGYGEGMYATWSSVAGASDYNVYVDGTRIDKMLVRQYPGYMTADAVGLKAGRHTMRVVPVMNGNEDGSKAAETTAAVKAHDRSGFGFVYG